MLHVETFSADCGGDCCFPHRHALVDLYARATTNAQGYNEDRCFPKVVDDRWNCASHLNGFTREPANARMGIAPDNTATGHRDFRKNLWPNILAEESDAVDVGFPVHGSREDDERS